MRISRLPTHKKKTARFTLAEALEIEAYCSENDQSFSQVCRRLFREMLQEQDLTNNQEKNTPSSSVGFLV